MVRFYLLLITIFIVPIYSCSLFDTTVNIQLSKENNISIVGTFIDTGRTYSIIINKIARLDTLAEEGYLDKLFIKDAAVYVENPKGEKFYFKYAIIRERRTAGTITLPQIDGYQTPRFPITDGNYKLRVEWKGTIYESTCSPMALPQLTTVEIMPAPIDQSKVTRANLYGKTLTDFSNWCVIYFSFSYNKEKENYFIVEYIRGSINPQYRTNEFMLISSEILDKTYLSVFNEPMIKYKMGKRSELLTQLSAPYPAIGGGVNIGDTVKVRMFSLNMLQVKLEESSYTPIINRTNIKNITDPSKPPIGYFVINRYIEKSAIRTK